MYWAWAKSSKNSSLYVVINYSDVCRECGGCRKYCIYWAYRSVYRSKVVGSDYRLIMPISFLGGATLVIWADVLARLVNQPYETPIGLFTSLVGVPLFIWMVRKEG